MREEERWLRHGEMVSAIFLLAANFINNPDVKVGPQRALRSSTKYLTLNPKISVNPYSILHPFWAK